MGEKGLIALENLPPGYYAPAPGSQAPGTTEGSHPEAKSVAGMAFPEGRPGYPITWDDEHGTWRPPGFTLTSDPDQEHVFNQATGQNGVWDETTRQWIDTQTGKPIGYEQ